MYDNEDIILETVDTTINGGAPTTETITYLHGPGVDEPLMMQKGGVNYYYHADALGSITELTDSGQAVVESYRYTSFGVTTKISGNLNNSFRFTGREFDSEIGVYYYRARYYDPNIGRFISKDPIGIAGGVNLYNYVQGNPVNYTDPYGLTTYQCMKPLDFLGGAGTRSGFDVPGNPLYHQYSCVKDDSTGKITCGGQSRSEILPYGSGQPSNDIFVAEQCKTVMPRNICFESCMRETWSEERPYYGLLGPATNCQEYDNSLHESCKARCGWN